MPFSLRPITGRIGAVVEGFDLTTPPDFPAILALRTALNEHKALVFDGAHLDDAGQERVAGWFGELTTVHPDVPATGRAPNVLAVEGGTPPAGAWHADVTYVVNPPQVSTLRPVACAPCGGVTLVANAAAAYRDLPRPLRVLADSLRAVHTDQDDPARPAAYEAEHPVVRVHPLTGERGLFVGGSARRIAGLSAAGSEALLRLLQTYVTRPQNVLRWTWSPGQLLVADNRVTQHRAAAGPRDVPPGRLHRVTVAGEVPTGVDGRRSEQLTGDASRYAAVRGAERGIGAAA